MTNLVTSVMLISLSMTVLLSASSAQASLWQAEENANRGVAGADNIQYFVSDEQALRGLLGQVPPEHSGQSIEIELPMPDGSLAKYNIFESSIMESGLAEKFPQIKSYKIFGLDHPGASGRADISPRGFRAMIMSPYGRIFIDPDAESTSRYMARTSAIGAAKTTFQCSVYDIEGNRTNLRNFSPVVSNSSLAYRTSGSLTAYRLAVSATPEYVTAVGGTLTLALAEITTAINRVNEIYERDLGIRFYLVADNDRVIDLPPGNAGFSNNNSLALLSQNQSWIDSKIGVGNYDIGHIFSTGSGGVAQLQSVCSIAKAQGATGLPNPTGDSFYIDFVAHEIGHQFGGNHSFNGSEGFCGGQRNSSTAFEPGSGSTIMAYAGICGAENIQSFTEATFHAGTIAEVNSFVGGAGGSCATILPITPGNADPVMVNAGIDRTIPANTAFRLTGSGSDTDSGDVLSYQWDQIDAGGAIPTNASTIGTDTGNNPLFRSNVPQPTAARDFPSLDNQLSGINDIAEVLPTTSRDLNFRLTARDCKSGQASDDLRISIDDNSGPFVITSQTTAITFAATSNPTVTWNVAGTNLSPVSCPEVDIELLTFSADGTTYASTVLADNTANDGSEVLTISDRSNAQARFKVSCSNNIFYDISDADLNITGTIPFATTGNSAVISSAASCGALDVVGTVPGGRIGGGSGGGGAVDFFGLFTLLGFLLRAYKRS